MGNRYRFKGLKRYSSPVSLEILAKLSELRALINDLFGDGQQGLLFVPKPVVLGEQRLYKLSDFTDPVTAGGDPTGGGKEVSGNGNHLTQSVSADRPTYNTDGTLHWLSGDGVSTFMEVSNGLTASGVDSLFICAAVKPDTLPTKSSPSGHGTDESHVIGQTGSSNDSFGVTISSGGIAFYIDGDLTGEQFAGSIAAGETAVITAVYDGVEMYLRKNGLEIGRWSQTGVLANSSNTIRVMGRDDQASTQLDGAEYAVSIVFSVPDISVIERAESYFADRAGITL